MSPARALVDFGEEIRAARLWLCHIWAGRPQRSMSFCLEQFSYFFAFILRHFFSRYIQVGQAGGERREGGQAGMDAGKRYYDRGKRETAPVIAEIDEREPGKHRHNRLVNTDPS